MSAPGNLRRLPARTAPSAAGPQSAPPQAPPDAGAAAPVPGFATLDRSFRAAQARATGGISPMALAAPWAEWAFHLARAPGKQMELALRLQVMAARYALWLARAAGDPTAEPVASPRPGDRRFTWSGSSPAGRRAARRSSSPGATWPQRRAGWCCATTCSS